MHEVKLILEDAVKLGSYYSTLE